MTLAQFLEVVRRRHNAENDSNWSDDEIYQLLTNRINEALVVVGLLEATSTDTSVVGTQAYNYPSDCITIRQVDYDDERLKRITFRQWELYKSQGSGTVSGTPRFWFTWNRQVNLVPVPAAAGDDIDMYYYQSHPYIDGSTQTTIDIPAVLHPYLVPGVLADMFEKDLNDQAARRNEEKWLNVSIPRFEEFKSDEESDGSFSVVGDADSDLLTELGPV